MDDSFGAAENTVRFDVLGNDTIGDNARIVSVSQPSVGSVEIDGNEVVVSVPPSFAGTLAFSYTVTDDSGAEATADVQVFSVNVLSPASQSTNITDAPGIETPAELVERFSALFVGLLQVRLTSVQLSTLAFAPLVFGVLRWMFVRKEYLVSVTNAPRSRSIDVGADAGVFKLRHNAVIWSYGRTRKLSNGKVKALVELPTGDRSWIDADLIADTGF